jgi:hypothetical protein
MPVPQAGSRQKVIAITGELANQKSGLVTILSKRDQAE